MLHSISLQHNLKPIDSLCAKDYMDDGSVISLTLTINRLETFSIYKTK